MTAATPAGVTSTTVTQSPELQQPRRNLTSAFDAICVGSPEDAAATTTTTQTKKQHTVSPTGVADVLSSTASTVSSPSSSSSSSSSETVSLGVPDLELHADLQRDLSLGTVERVSCFSILHDINKEATAMASHDPLLEHECPLVRAVVTPAEGVVRTTTHHDTTTTTCEHAMLDEELWLLSAMQAETLSSSPESTTNTTSPSCPPTFLQAMGECEYNHKHGARTQLWKPSRSWWEAKSGKNPWMEPSMHNKRWRYLWPLIHYHKFLAKCIKKLKRNGVDVKLCESPVALFLRREVCAVSDHLAAVSLFDAPEWMACLQYFEGWTKVTPQAEEQYRRFVQQLPLRPLDEYADVDSPLLRSQLDDAFLKTMALQREQMREQTTTTTTATAPEPTDPTVEQASRKHVPRQIHGVRRPRYYPPGWYDTNSVHSELSANSSHHYPPPAAQGQPYMYLHGYYSDTSAASTVTTGGGGGYPYHYPYVDMSGYYNYAPYYSPYDATAATPDTPTSTTHTPNGDVSPYWAHLDQATVAMGLATPKGVVTPRTPRRARTTQDAAYVAPLLRYTKQEPPSPATQFLMSPPKKSAV